MHRSVRAAVGSNAWVHSTASSSTPISPLDLSPPLSGGDREDRRSFLVTLTDKGMATVDAAMKDHAANEAALLSWLSQQQQQQLNDTMYTLLRTVKDQDI